MADLCIYSFQSDEYLAKKFDSSFGTILAAHRVITSVLRTFVKVTTLCDVFI